MALEQAFMEFFKQTVTIAPYLNNNPDGSAAFDTPVTYPARVAGASRRIMSNTGEVVDATQAIYLPTDAAITPRDQITLPEGYEPRQPAIIAVNKYPDETGAIHHQTIYV